MSNSYTKRPKRWTRNQRTFFKEFSLFQMKISSRISFSLRDWGGKVVKKFIWSIFLFYQCFSFGHLSFFVFKLLLSLLMCTISIDLGSCRNLNYMLNKLSGACQFISKVIHYDRHLLQTCVFHFPWSATSFDYHQWN